MHHVVDAIQSSNGWWKLKQLKTANSDAFISSHKHQLWNHWVPGKKRERKTWAEIAVVPSKCSRQPGETIPVFVLTIINREGLYCLFKHNVYWCKKDSRQLCFHFDSFVFSARFSAVSDQTHARQRLCFTTVSRPINLTVECLYVFSGFMLYFRFFHVSWLLCVCLSLGCEDLGASVQNWSIRKKKIAQCFYLND